MFEVHLVGLADGPDYDLDSCTSNLMSLSVISPPNPSRKAGHRSDNGKVIFMGEISVNANIFGVPTLVTPKILPLSSSCFHTSI